MKYGHFTVEHAEGHGDRMYEAVCKLGFEGIVSKKLDAPYKSGPSKAWLKIKNPKARLQLGSLSPP
jgi:ATP-dependent DNA ligase